MTKTSDKAGGSRSTAGSRPGGDELARLLLNSTGEGIYGIDLQGRCTFANPACLETLGFESDAELLGRNMHQLVHHTRPDGTPYPEKECRIYKAFREHKGTHVDDEVMFRKDGSSFPAEYWSYPVERDGELIGCVLTFVDISERRQQRKLLADQAAELAEVARFPEMNPGPVLRLDLEGTVLMSNPAAQAAFGDDLVGRSWRKLCPDLDDATWTNILGVDGASLILERTIADREYVLTHRHDSDSELVFVFGADVTEQKRAERALREADELVRLLLNSTGEGIYGVDLDGNCTFANPACARILGYETVDDFMGKHMHDLVHHTRPNGEPYPVKECRIYQAFREGKGVHVDDEVMFRADGNAFPAEYWSYPMKRDGELQGCVVTFVDISERRKVEEELRQTEKMAALGKLSAGLAHELNNPAAAAGRAAGQLVEALDELNAASVELTRGDIDADAWASVLEWAGVIGGRAEEPLGLSPLEVSDREEELGAWLAERGVPEPWDMSSTLVEARVAKEDLEELAGMVPGDLLGGVIGWLCQTLTARSLAGSVARSTRSISELVGVVKSYSYMDQAQLQHVDIHKGLEDTITILHHKLKRGIEVVRDYDRDLPKVEVQGSELNQVWTNLIDNAIDAMGGQGTITVRTLCRDGQVNVEIEDDGPGIPEEIQARIFDPFFTTKDVGEGTGLGLDVVRRIVTARCGGQIDVDSRPGRTVFRVRIPIDPACEAKEA